MKTRYLFSFTFLLIFLATVWNSVSAQDRKLIVFYNVENLFDIYDDPQIDDSSYLPDSRIAWTEERYQKKLDNLTKVLTSIDETYLPAIIGLCEVENIQVVEDLSKSGQLKRGKYKIVHFDSPDRRGIDNAFLYAKSEFRTTGKFPVSVSFPDNPDVKTRDILYVKGVFKKATKDTIHFFVNHWPSRWGGQERSEPLRVQTARIMRITVDSIMSTNPSAKIFIMGDFNDEPVDTSMSDVLGAVKFVEDPLDNELYNLMYPMYNRREGTLFYNDWDVFDQFIVSGATLKKDKGFCLADTQGKAFGPEWMMFEWKNNILRPNRTAGRDYYGGFSDHLPVYIYYEIKKYN